MKKVLLLLPEGFETFEASVFLDVIGWNLVDGDHTTELFTCGLRHEVKTSFNQKWVVDYQVNDINVDDYDALAIPGGFEAYNFYNDGYNEELLNLIRAFEAKNKLIASICVGALLLGKSGILKNRKATTYNKTPKRFETLKSYCANVIKEPIVLDNNVITSWDPSTAIDVALLLLEKLTNKPNADYIKEIMGFDERKRY